MITRRFWGYAMAVTGLLLLFYNAFVYLSSSTWLKIPAFLALMLCMAGALLVRKSQKSSNK